MARVVWGGKSAAKDKALLRAGEAAHCGKCGAVVLICHLRVRGATKVVSTPGLKVRTNRRSSKFFCPDCAPPEAVEVSSGGSQPE